MSATFCTNCGAALAQTTDFCTECGVKVVGSSAQSGSAKKRPSAKSTSAKQTTRKQRRANRKSKREQSSFARTYIIGTVALLAALTVIYFAFLNPSGTVGVDIPYPEVERISAREAMVSFRDGSAIFLDVRDRDSYTAMHITGAVWMPYTEVGARYNELPQDAEIITYCT